MNIRTTAAIAAIITAGLAATGCAATKPAAQTRPNKPSASATVADVGDDTLNLGVTKRFHSKLDETADPADQYAGDRDVTVLGYHSPLRHPSYETVARGHVYAGLEIKQCAVNTTVGTLGVGWDPWTLDLSDDSSLSPASSYYNDLAPLYPMDKVLKDGRCVKGSIIFEVPRDKKVLRAVYQADDASSATEWTISSATS